MNPRTAPLLLAVGVVLGSAFTLYADLPAAALAGWVVALVGVAWLAKAADDEVVRGDGVTRDSFRLARTGAVLGVAASALRIGGVDDAAFVVLGILATGLVLRGSAAAIAAAVPEEWRSAAGTRIARFAIAGVAVLCVAAALELAGTGPSWTSEVALVLRGVVMAAVVWLAAYAVASREALATGGATA
ncbi:hypothetical protein GCM10011584_28310 [Nocardioides phosphati]|uniref:DUF308 domain-containing protein n=1 Tax=Nocardioides phosphati TaxID=1867775 RepID=A0ABQ2NDD7_9ACTN|nr:hypothetical protein [Nocardioides phosphati]GGO92279.1 hypothetical protein GCM10011584_28310 [Nocardioides phosphati]